MIEVQLTENKVILGTYISWLVIEAGNLRSR